MRLVSHNGLAYALLCCFPACMHGCLAQAQSVYTSNINAIDSPTTTTTTTTTIAVTTRHDGVDTPAVSGSASGSTRFEDATTRQSLVTSSSSSSSSSSSGNNIIINSTGTCRSGTVNYMTHTLPQQCLTTSRHVPTQIAQSGLDDAHSLIADADSRLAATETRLPGQDSCKTNDDASASEAAHGGETTTTIAAEASPGSQQSSSDTGSVTTSTTITTTTTSTTTTATTSTTSTTDAEAELESDSPLDNANFLSFEEWKKQNLAAAGQSPEHLAQRAANPQQARTRPDIHALDGLGDESEIELDFSGFGGATRVGSDGGSKMWENGNAQRQEGGKAGQTQRGDDKEDSSKTEAAAGAGPVLRSRDAGKTCKERSNYASFDCAATVLKSNAECKSAGTILIENKDSYMLNPCSAPNKFFIVELCDDILIDTIVLANYEFFSSIFRSFRVSVSDRYPVKPDRWKQLGVFEAQNTRQVQAFLVEQPLIWARYLRVEFLTHYGNEYYCPLSLLRVHGTTMMEEFRHQEEVARGEHLEEIEEPVTPEAVAQPLADMPHESLLVSVEVEADKSAADSVPVASETVDSGRSTRGADVDDTVSHSTDVVASGSDGVGEPSTPVSLTDTTTVTSTVSEPSRGGAVTSARGDDTSLSQAASETTDSSTVAAAPNSRDTAMSASDHTNSPALGSSADPAPTAYSVSQSTATSATTNTTSDHVEAAAVHKSSSVAKSASSSSPTSTVSINQNPPTATQNASSLAKPSDHAPKPSPSSSHPPAPLPTTQESIFKALSKRLSSLEANATLSLQYIESQSQLLRDAFAKVEKRQLLKTTTFLESLNRTVSNDLSRTHAEIEHLWQATVVELDGLRARAERESQALGVRVALLADELVYQRRLVIVQSTLLMLCLGLVLFSRSATAHGAGVVGGVEGSLLQQLARNGAERWGRARSPAAAAWSPPLSPELVDADVDAEPEARSPSSAGDAEVLGAQARNRNAPQGGSWSKNVRRRSGFWRRSVDTAVTVTGARSFSGDSRASHNSRSRPGSSGKEEDGVRVGTGLDGSGVLPSIEVAVLPPTPRSEGAVRNARGKGQGKPLPALPVRAGGSGGLVLNEEEEEARFAARGNEDEREEDGRSAKETDTDTDTDSEREKRHAVQEEEEEEEEVEEESDSESDSDHDHEHAAKSPTTHAAATVNTDDQARTQLQTHTPSPSETATLLNPETELETDPTVPRGTQSMPSTPGGSRDVVVVDGVSRDEWMGGVATVV